VPAEPVPVPPVQPGAFPPKVIRNADMQVQVRAGSFDRAWSRALDIAPRYGGFVTNSSAQQNDSHASTGSITIRVPANKLEAAVKDLRGLGLVKGLSSSASDVSGQVAAMDARIKGDEAEEAQMLDLLKRAQSVGDVLAVRTQLIDIQQDLHSLQAQKRSFQDQVDYATINATIFEPKAGPQQPVPLPVSDGIISRAWHSALTAGLTIAAGTLVVLGGLIPLALIGLAVWTVVMFARRRRST
jgi:hypothetical protein